MRKRVAVLMAVLLAGVLFTGPVAAEQVDETVYNDYFFRPVGYALHPVGVALDLAVVKPGTFFLCITPWLFGLSPGECPQERATPFGD